MTIHENPHVRNKLIVALDVSTASAASGVAGKLRGRVGLFKVGSELFCAEGPTVVRNLVAGGDKVFLDLKFNDIPNTVRAAAREAAQLGASMFTVHASGGRKMMEAAVEGARTGADGPGKQRPLVLAVTILTSLADDDLLEIGLKGSPEESVVRLAGLARASGVDGVVASPRETAAIRKTCGPNFIIVTPGIRPALSSNDAESARAMADDQARFATPIAAIQSGANFLVVGRPITEAPDPAAAAEAIVHEMERAFEPSPA